MNPYTTLPDRAFWKLSVADKEMLGVSDLWRKKFEIGYESKIATFGSCFAQHFGRALRGRGFKWMDAEPAPRGMSEQAAARFNYGVFSARTGNIYTTSLLRQWVEWTLGITPVPDEIWESNGRYFDPFRPNIEPNGFASEDEVRLSRKEVFKALNQIIRRSDVFVFTLGLTESWTNAKLGYEYPMCPGTIAGSFDESEHQFSAQSFGTVSENLQRTLRLLNRVNPRIKVLLTVSPVPLTATNSGDHVLVATSASKSILRAATEAARHGLDFVDYFPSYEIISSPAFKGAFFKPNLRQVRQEGVDFVMQNFFSALDLPEKSKSLKAGAAAIRDAEVKCEEELLAAFANKDA